MKTQSKPGSKTNRELVKIIFLEKPKLEKKKINKTKVKMKIKTKPNTAPKEDYSV